MWKSDSMMRGRTLGPREPTDPEVGRRKDAGTEGTGEAEAEEETKRCKFRGCYWVTRSLGSLTSK